MSFSGSPAGKESTYKAGDPGSIPGLGRFPGEEHGNPLQYPCQENPVGREAWQATVQDLDMTERLSSAQHSCQPVSIRTKGPCPGCRGRRAPGTSLVIQSLGLCPPNAGGRALIPGQGIRSHMLKLKTQNAITKGPHVRNWGSHLPRLDFAQPNKINK